MFYVIVSERDTVQAPLVKQKKTHYRGKRDVACMQRDRNEEQTRPAQGSRAGARPLLVLAATVAGYDEQHANQHGKPSLPRLSAQDWPA